MFDLTLGGRIKIIDKSFTEALLLLSRRLDGSGVKWVVDGDLAEALQVVQVDPDCIEILTNANDAKMIWSSVKDLNPTPIAWLEQPLARKAVIKGEEYPITIKIHSFEFDLNGTKIKVCGDKQFRINGWDWGDPLEVEPRYVNIVGQPIPVVPLSFQLQMYEKLGWTDRIEKISKATSYLKSG